MKLVDHYLQVSLVDLVVELLKLIKIKNLKTNQRCFVLEQQMCSFDLVSVQSQ